MFSRKARMDGDAFVQAGQKFSRGWHRHVCLTGLWGASYSPLFVRGLGAQTKESFPNCCSWFSSNLFNSSSHPRSSSFSQMLWGHNQHRPNRILNQPVKTQPGIPGLPYTIELFLARYTAGTVPLPNQNHLLEAVLASCYRLKFK